MRTLAVVCANLLLCCIANLSAIAQYEAPLAAKQTVKVFVLAGQSNMQGHAVIDLDHEERYNGGKGTLLQLMQDPKRKKRYAHLKTKDGKWVVRDDVWLIYQTKTGLKAGGLTIGQAGYDDMHHFGPELQFGHAVGDYFDEPVLIIKTAWGGKSLKVDFRPPSSDGETGPYYTKMVSEIRSALDSAAEKFPRLKDRNLELSGFVWQQGWNDMCDSDAIKEYEQNLLNLIKDVRAEFESPDLPFVIGELGNGGDEVNEPMKNFRKAQLAATKHGDPGVQFVPTARFARPAQESPNTGHGHHWFGNAESYFLIGDALGKKMVAMVGDKPRVLILGDSISMGYTPFVKKALNDRAVVHRPRENCAGTTKGIKKIDEWLQVEGGNWDVIHFNFGLHDLKHVKADTGKNSNDPNDPQQADLETYQKNLRQIMEKLKATNAKLIFATTTCVPDGVRPFRSIDAPQQYNAAALSLAKEFEIQANDLYKLSVERQKEIQRPKDVHFTKQGSQELGKQVVNSISGVLGDKIK